MSQVDAIRSFFLNPRSWYPVTEAAAAMACPTEELISKLRDPFDLSPEDWRIRPDGIMEVQHDRLVWRVFERVGASAVQNALGEEAPSVIPADRLTETITIRVQRWCLAKLRDGATKRGWSLEQAAEDALAYGVEDDSGNRPYTMAAPSDDESPIHWIRDDSVKGGYRRAHPDDKREVVREGSERKASEER